jgi:ankyrin repeat protein
MTRLLIEKGADITARDGAGRTALDWALLQGDTPVATLLRAAGATQTVTLTTPPSAGTPQGPRTAVSTALARLNPVGRNASHATIRLSR